MADILVRNADNVVLQAGLDGTLSAAAGETVFTEAGPPGGFIPPPGHATWVRNAVNDYTLANDDSPTNDNDQENVIAYRVIKSAQAQPLGATFIDLTLDADAFNTGDFTHTAGTAGVTVLVSGIYWVSWWYSYIQTGGNARSDVEGQLLVNGTPVAGSLIPSYSRNTAQGEGHIGNSFPINLTAGDELTIQVRRISGAGTIQSKANGSGMGIMSAKGVQGDTGPQGPAGTTPVFGSEFVRGSETALATTTGAPDSTNYLTVPTGNRPAGEYRVGWVYGYNNSNTATECHVNVKVDGANLIDPVNGGAAVQEVKDSTGTIEVIVKSGFGYAVFGAAGTHTIDVNFGQTNGGSATLRFAYVEWWRVT